jgi:hypothetical protein
MSKNPRIWDCHSSGNGNSQEALNIINIATPLDYGTWPAFSWQALRASLSLSFIPSTQPTQ